MIHKMGLYQCGEALANMSGREIAMSTEVSEGKSPMFEEGGEDALRKISSSS